MTRGSPTARVEVVDRGARSARTGRCGPVRRSSACPAGRAMTALAVALAMLAARAALLEGRVAAAGRPAGAAGSCPGRWSCSPSGCRGAGLWSWLDVQQFVLVVLLGLVVARGRPAGARRRAARAADRTADQVLAVCDAMASDLAAGQPPLASLRPGGRRSGRSSRRWPSPGEMGADVPEPAARAVGAARRRPAAHPGRDVAGRPRHRVRAGGRHRAGRRGDPVRPAHRAAGRLRARRGARHRPDARRAPARGAAARHGHRRRPGRLPDRVDGRAGAASRSASGSPSPGCSGWSGSPTGCSAGERRVSVLVAVLVGPRGAPVVRPRPRLVRRGTGSSAPGPRSRARPRCCAAATAARAGGVRRRLGDVRRLGRVGWRRCSARWRCGWCSGGPRTRPSYDVGSGWSRDLPTGVDLLAACLDAGSAPESALVTVSRALAGPVGEEFLAIHHRLEVGVDPAQVWRSVAGHPQLGPLGRAVGRAHETGAPSGGRCTSSPTSCATGAGRGGGPCAEHRGEGRGAPRAVPAAGVRGARRRADGGRGLRRDAALP